ncbi:MAG: RNA polymerase sigma factor [Nannocystaceae bacterium]
MQSDAELLAAWRGGDRSSGRALFERHFDSVRRFFANKVDHGVEDLVQRTFLACVEARDRFREEASFRTFLFAIAHNLLRKHFRARARGREDHEIDALSIVDLGQSPISLLAVAGEGLLLLQGLRRIPLASQIILELYFWEGLTGRELGLLLGVPEDTARARLRRAKRDLEGAIRQLEASPGLLESTISDLDRWAASVRAQVGR